MSSHLEVRCNGRVEKFFVEELEMATKTAYELSTFGDMLTVDLVLVTEVELPFD